MNFYNNFDQVDMNKGVTPNQYIPFVTCKAITVKYNWVVQIKVYDGNWSLN